ncbi:MAG: insulinase family protein [Treponema sp.]|nr:insulinase family protein [Treponema sp.]
MVKKLLKNNVTLLVQQMKGCKSASIGFYFTVGSRLEKEGEYGISHFTEHMLFKGTSTLSTHQIACTFDRWSLRKCLYREGRRLPLFNAASFK